MVDYFNDAPGAPKAVGPYSQAASANGLVFLSGQIPLDPKSGKLVEGGIESQAEQVLKNLAAVLNHLKLDFSNVVKATIFLTDLSHFKSVNAIYERHLGSSRPARATIQVAALPLSAEIEIEMIASLQG